MSSRRERAAIRRASWAAEVVALGSPKGSLYADLSPAQRLAALAELNERLWLASGRRMPEGDRHSWPGEVFEIERRV